MSEETKEITNKEALEALGSFANICYDRGARDTCVGALIGGAVIAGVMILNEVIETRKDRRETKQKIKDFNNYTNYTKTED